MPDLGPDALVLSFKVGGNSVKEQYYPSATMFVIDKEVGSVLMKNAPHSGRQVCLSTHSILFSIV